MPFGGVTARRHGVVVPRDVWNDDTVRRLSAYLRAQ